MGTDFVFQAKCTIFWLNRSLRVHLDLYAPDLYKITTKYYFFFIKGTLQLKKLHANIKKTLHTKDKLYQVYTTLPAVHYNVVECNKVLLEL